MCSPCITLSRAQPEDGSIIGAETCCYKLFNYLLVVITAIIYIYIYVCVCVCVCVCIEHNVVISPENYGLN